MRLKESAEREIFTVRVIEGDVVVRTAGAANLDMYAHYEQLTPLAARELAKRLLVAAEEALR